MSRGTVSLSSELWSCFYSSLFMLRDSIKRENSLICSSAFWELILAQWNQSHLPTAIWQYVSAVQSTTQYKACMLHHVHVPPYLWFRDARPPRRGIRSPCSWSCRPSSRSRHSLGRWRPSARLAADRLPCLPAGTPGWGWVTC